MRHPAISLVAFCAALVPVGRATADTLDLTTAGTSGFLNGALFRQTSPQPTGVGTIQSFLRLQNNGVEQGYNTSARPIESGYDTKTDPNFTRDRRLDQIPIVTIDGVAYREFLLDINENTGSNQELLSLDRLQIFQSNAGNVNQYANLGTKVYDLGSGNTIVLNYALNAGSGLGDMFAYIPDSRGQSADVSVDTDRRCLGVP